MSSISRSLDKFFKISERNSSISTEIRSGCVTFFTMAYIIILNPLILGGKDSFGELLDPSATGRIAAMTSLIAGVLTILMGIVANFPIALAAGLGINSVVAVSAATLPGATWADVMGLVVIEGIVMLVIVLTGVRKIMFKVMPETLRLSISVGIGFFLVLIGLWDSGFVNYGEGTPLKIGNTGSINSIPLVLFVICFFMIVILTMKKVKGAILISIIVSTILGFIAQAIFHIGLGAENNGFKSVVPQMSFDNIFKPFDLSLLGHFNVLGSFQNIGVVTSLMIVFSLLLSNFFDGMGTIVGVANQGGLVDKDNNPLGVQKIFVIESIGAIAGGGAGISSNTVFIESASGVADGARTGLASVTTGILFLISMFFSPIVSYIPSETVTPALVFIGLLMFFPVTDINWKDWTNSVPAFLTILVMPFTYSITSGIGAGIISYVVLKTADKKAKKVHPLLWGAAGLFVIYFAQSAINALLHI